MLHISKTLVNISNSVSMNSKVQYLIYKICTPESWVGNIFKINKLHSKV